MLYRLLGKFFMFFFVIPSITRAWRFARPIVAKTLCKMIEDITKDETEARARSRRDHPAGSRLPKP